MGTTYNIKVVSAKDSLDRDQLSMRVTELLSEINARMSTYLRDSEISRVNDTSVGSWLDVSPEFCALVERSSKISEDSGGAFDATVGPLVNLWGFGPQGVTEAPTQDELSAVMKEVGYQNLDSDCYANRIRKASNLYIDFSAIAKGHATQVIAEAIMNDDVMGLMIEIGGELTLRGHNQEGVAWRIAVEKPSLGSRSASQVLGLHNVSVATSGDYRNFYELEGERVSHTISPSTGRPVIHNLASVTVVHERGADADAWATALNVVGEESAYELANQNNLAAYFIVRDESGFSVKYTEAFKKYMVTP